jgi:hypothetical protein
MQNKYKIYISIIISASLIIACGLCTTEKKDGKEIRYEVKGIGGPVDIAARIDGHLEQYSNVEIPWKKTFILKTTEHTYISAQNLKSSGSITVYIYVNGSKVAESTVDGNNGAATATEFIKVP